jgi:hypothetical protein
MRDSPALPPASGRLRPEDKLFVWLVLITSWLVLAAWGVYQFKPYFQPRPPSITVRPGGKFITLKEYAGTLTFRSSTGQEITLAGITLEGLDEAARARAGARLRALAPPGTVVFIDSAQGPPINGDKEATASVWLSPKGEMTPLPPDDLQLLAAVLVQEGLVRVDETRPYIYQTELLMLADDACRHGRGLWAGK